ncbi:MAG: PQQ-binding-like beta-propeller repeat protein [Armatimonadetes bacterium]|nr:PQQ-binding-like beta-propeller repeat protein [Armatimonadota bacterium]
MRRWLLLLGLAPALALGVDDFAFWQFSDTHAPLSASGVVIGAARQRVGQGLPNTPPPAFAIVTGDLTEFGQGEGWATFSKWFSGWPVPIRFVPGNHDNTWWLLRPALQELPGGLPWSFDHGGVHFAGLDSAGRGDPRPGFSLEELDWLSADLAKLQPGMPVILAFHHPLSGSEWASPADYERLLTRLQPYNIALMLVGHGHAAARLKFGDYDAVEGGSTFDNGAKPASAGNAGFNVISIKGGILRAAYHRNTDLATEQLLIEKPLTARPPLPAARVEGRVEGNAVRVTLTVPGGLTAGTVALDGGKPVPVNDAGQAIIPLADAEPGQHLLRAEAKIGDRVCLASADLLVHVPGAAGARWRALPGGSFRAVPAMAPGRVYVASLGGQVSALDLATGRTLWQTRLPGEVIGGPLLAGGRVIVPTTTGLLVALDPAGAIAWRYDANAPLTATPTLAADRLVIGAADGSVHCVGLDGKPVWHRPVADYSIESPIAASGGRLFLGAWDTFIRGLNAADGAELWKAVCEGSTNRPAAKYYSPADAGPTVLGDRVFCADRHYDLTIVDAATGARIGTRPGVVSTSPAADGTGVWAKLTDKEGPALARLDRDGKVVWRCAVPAGSLPSAPAEGHGLVAVTSNTGLVSAVSAADGKLRWQYRVCPGYYVPGAAVAEDGTVVVAAADGSVTAVAGG